MNLHTLQMLVDTKASFNSAESTLWTHVVRCEEGDSDHAVQRSIEAAHLDFIEATAGMKIVPLTGILAAPPRGTNGKYEIVFYCRFRRVG